MKDKSSNLGFLPPEKKKEQPGSLVGSDTEKAKA